MPAKTAVDPFAEPEESAAAASLRHVTDTAPGISRERAGDSFRYRDPDGKVIRDKPVLDRIAALAIPPAWTDVWICRARNGHLQATGRDARGRKQYRYHPRWREVRDAAKYGRLAEFARALPKIRTRVTADLRRRGLPVEKVLAAVVRLLETTRMRIGNEEYARTNGSFGLSTLLDEHVKVSRSKVRFHFVGKSGKEHDVAIDDTRLSRLVIQCRDLPGQDLFQYQDTEGEPHPITSTAVNDYIRDAAGAEFTAKDFRTWAGTLLAIQAITAPESPCLEGNGKSAVTAMVRRVADQLGNTPAVCRKCYIHPAVLAVCQDPQQLERWQDTIRRKPVRKGLAAEEAVLLRFLEEAPRSTG